MKLKRPADIEKYLGLPTGTFDEIPHYAREGAIEAIRRVMTLERKQLFRPGLYYIVLSDLSRSTEAARHLGPTLNKRRVESFILKSLEAFGSVDFKNYAMFLKEIGDAVLFVFSSFEDVLDWFMIMEEFLSKQNEIMQYELNRDQFKYFRIETKTIVHAGEVAYSDGKRPMALCVNDIFKMEKLFGPNELGVSQTALLPILPILKETIFTHKVHKAVLLPGDSVPMKTFKLVLEAKRRRTKRCS